MTVLKDRFEYRNSIKKQILLIIGNLPNKYFGEIITSSLEDDMVNSTDFNFIIVTDKGNISCRIRNPFDRHGNLLKYRDWSIRSYNNGHDTEIHKLREGKCPWYFYGWTNKKYQIHEWVFIDIERVVQSGFLERDFIDKMKWDERRNYNKNGEFDGTIGLYIPIPFLFKHDCIVEFQHNYSFLYKDLSFLETPGRMKRKIHKNTQAKLLDFIKKSDQEV